MQDFAEQIAALQPTLARVALQRLRNPAWAEDAVSETLVAALESHGSFAGRAQLRTWLVGILKHKLVDQIRRHTRECQLETFEDELEFTELPGDANLGAFDAPAEWGDPQERLSQRQFMAQFDQCLKQLPAQQGRAFVLRNVREEDTESICHQLGVTSNHLWVLLHRARNQLRVSLQQRGFAGAGRATDAVPA